MEHDSDELFQYFIGKFSRDSIADEAEQALREKAPSGGAPFVFRDSPGGLIGFVLCRLLLAEAVLLRPQETDDLVSRLVEFYAFPEDWVPPRFLVREAIAHAIQLRRLSERLSRDLSCRVDAGEVLWSYAMRLSSPQSAFLLTDEQTDDVIQQVRTDL